MPAKLKRDTKISGMKNPNRRTVLSVDDDEVNQMVISAFLEGAGYTIIQVYNGEDCLSYLDRAFGSEDEATTIPDIVLLDVVMPGMNGFEVCREIRRRYPASLPVIIISAANMAKKDVIHALKYSLANDYLTKPFDRAILLGKIEARTSLADSIKSLSAHYREEYCHEMSRSFSSL